MKWLIRASLANPHAVIVLSLAILVAGWLALPFEMLPRPKSFKPIPIDILPVSSSPAVQVLTFYGGMPAAGVEKDITNRMERWTSQAEGMKRQESRSILGASVVRNYFFDDIDPNGALTTVNSLALATLPNLPPGTLPPVVMKFDPTSTTPVAIVALDSPTPDYESILYDVARYEVRPMIIQVKGASALVAIGGKLRAVMLYIDQTRMQARGYSAHTIMDAVERFNLFFPSGDVRIGDKYYALSSNSMIPAVERMGDIPLRARSGNAEYLRDLAKPEDASFIQTNVVRVNGRRQVYIPVYRQAGASTLEVVDKLRSDLPGMQARLSRGDINLRLVMDQSVYVRESISALLQEGILGAILCSLVILLFLGEWRMTLIAVLTLPLSALMAVVCLKFFNHTINVMTLAGLTLAIGPMIDSAIICLENTHRHLGMGASPYDAALEGASEVAMPELIATLCTFLVLAPLALIPGMGKFLFLPMMLAVMFAMATAYLLSRTLVPSFSYLLLRGHGGVGRDRSRDREGAASEPLPHGRGSDADAPRPTPHAPRGGLFARWEAIIEQGIRLYVRALNVVLRHRWATVAVAYGLLATTLVLLLPVLRRDFFPEADAGAFEIAVRAPAGTRIERTEEMIAQVERFIKRHIPKEDLELIISEIGLTADWSAAYTPNSGPQDAVLKVQLAPHRSRSAQEYVSLLRAAFAKDSRLARLEFAFDTGGLVRGALNEGKSTPLNIQVKGKDQATLYEIAERIKRDVQKVEGVVDARILQKLDAPELVVNVDRAKAADLGLTQDAIMKDIIAATNSSITFNKKNFWIDPLSHNQYFVGVQYPEKKIQSITDLLNIPIIAPNQGHPIPLKEVASIEYGQVPTEIHHVDIQSAIDLTMGVEGRDLGHVADEVTEVLQRHGLPTGEGVWQPYDPHAPGKKLLGGSRVVLSGEYSRMRSTFSSMAGGLILAALLIYFLMVGLGRSFLVPLAVMLAVPLLLVGVLLVLYLTGSALNVQSLLGIIFVVGINVSNTVLMTDYAQQLRRHEGLSPTEAIRKAAALRVRPVTMTALAALCAMIPTALALERGSEANAPLARAILGGLLAVEPATLFVLPALYSLLVPDNRKQHAAAGHPSEGEVHVQVSEPRPTPPAGPTPDRGMPDMGLS
jgi:multidrug efflux pump subunit AcrB